MRPHRLWDQLFCRGVGTGGRGGSRPPNISKGGANVPFAPLPQYFVSVQYSNIAELKCHLPLPIF